MLYWAQGTNKGVGIGAKGRKVGLGASLEVGAGAGVGVGVGAGADVVVGVVGAGHVSGWRTSSSSCLFSAVKHRNSSRSSTNSSGTQLRNSLSQPCWSLYPFVWPEELPACSHRTRISCWISSNFFFWTLPSEDRKSSWRRRNTTVECMLEVACDLIEITHLLPPDQARTCWSAHIFLSWYRTRRTTNWSPQAPQRLV